jgi:CRISPR-associated protein Cmr6
MTDQNKKPQNQWKTPGWSIGSERPIEKGKYKPPADTTGKKGYKSAPGQPGKPGPAGAGVGNKRYQRSNTGWLFYKEYYHGIDFQPGQKKDALKSEFAEKNRIITSRKLSRYREEVEALKLDIETIQWFEMATVYPGLATGLGTPHESHREGEYKLGFHFDHTTGLPIIPGSSVKGVLRSAFQKAPQYIKYLLENPQDNNTPITGIDIDKLEKEVFDGEGLSPYQRDVFLDAVIVSSENEKTLFLADDFITPHRDEFKDPVPLQFLKVLPRVVFRFQFRLGPGQGVPITVEIKLALFKRILEDLGIGAKTNVGYGKFTG